VLTSTSQSSPVASITTQRLVSVPGTLVVIPLDRSNNRFGWLSQEGATAVVQGTPSTRSTRRPTPWATRPSPFLDGVRLRSHLLDAQGTSSPTRSVSDASKHRRFPFPRWPLIPANSSAPTRRPTWLFIQIKEVQSPSGKAGDSAHWKVGLGGRHW